MDRTPGHRSLGPSVTVSLRWGCCARGTRLLDCQGRKACPKLASVAIGLSLLVNSAVPQKPFAQAWPIVSLAAWQLERLCGVNAEG